MNFRTFRQPSAVLAIVLCASACARRNAAEHVKKAQTYFDAQQYSEAALEYRNALQKDAQNGDVHLKLADTYMHLSDARNALREYVRAADLLPKSVEAQLKAGELLLAARQFEDAKSRADKAIELDQKSVDAQVLRGNALAGLKDLDAAMGEYQDAITLDPKSPTAYDNLAILQLAKGKREEAEATFKSAVQAAPSSVPARLALANFYWSVGRRDEAETVLKETVALDKDNLTANRALGLFYIATNRVTEAEPYFIALTRKESDEAALTLADYYVIANRKDEARTILRERAKQPKAFAAANIRIASLDAADGHLADAQQRLHDVLEKEPKNASALLLSARISIAEGKRDAARTSAQTVIKNDPVSSSAASAWMLVGSVDAASDRFEDAIHAYEQVLKMQSRPTGAVIALAMVYLGRGNADKATSYAQQALTMDPSVLDAQAILVRADLLRGDLSKAKADLEPLQKAQPKSIGVFKLSALIELASNHVDAARTAYERVLTANPNDQEALEALVRLDVGGGKSRAGAARMDARLKEATPTVALLTLAAGAHEAAGDIDRAEALLRQAIELDPDRLTAYTRLGGLYVRQKRLFEAIKSFREVAARNPKSVAASTMIGVLLEAQGDVKEAEKQYRQVLAIDSHAAVAANNLAWIYVASNRQLDDALQLAQTAYQTLPEDADVNDTLGWILYKKKLAARALPYLEKATAKHPNEPASHYHLGMAYVDQGEWNKARLSLERALQLKKDFDGAADAQKALNVIGTSAPTR
jgi:putative PEP-CTERM system TPR-repeat lipoprotein